MTTSAPMKLAIRSALKGIRSRDGGPFGACILRRGKVLAVSHNTVLKDKDPTCHAEINAIRAASKKIKNFDLSGSTIFSTTEPCPMCFAAIHWAKIQTVYYGTSILDVAKRGFNELSLSNHKMKLLGQSPVKIKAGIQKRPCLKLLEVWDRMDCKTLY